MDSERFAEIVDLQLNLCKDVLVDKAREYATDDRLHNFKVAAEIQGVDLLEACAGMMAKHTVSIYDMCGSEQAFSAEQWDEKITDHINYLILLRAIVFEMRDDEDCCMPIELTPDEQLAQWLSKYLFPRTSKPTRTPNA